MEAPSNRSCELIHVCESTTTSSNPVAKTNDDKGMIKEMENWEITYKFKDTLLCALLFILSNSSTKLSFNNKD